MEGFGQCRMFKTKEDFKNAYVLALGDFSIVWYLSCFWIGVHHHPAQMQPLSQQFYTLHWGEYWKQDKYKEKEALLTIMNLKDL